MTLKHTCGGCESTWTGLSMCHCSVCHHTFGGVDSFDRHRTVDGKCRPPMSIGLHWNDQRGVWSKTYDGPRVSPETQAVERETVPTQEVVIASGLVDPGSQRIVIAPGYSAQMINRLNEHHSQDW